MEATLSLMATADPVTPEQPTTPSPDQGYRDGYKLGYQDGQNFPEIQFGL